nr:MAG TPA: hypothetical protein [Caudoviricetes sp.]
MWCLTKFVCVALSVRYDASTIRTYTFYTSMFCVP